jgi:hypothetical protein
VGEHVSDQCVKITITITVTVTTIIVNMMQGIWQSGCNPPCGNAVQQQKKFKTKRKNGAYNRVLKQQF